MEMSTEEMLWAGLQAGPVHVLQNTSEGREESEAERDKKGITERPAHKYPGPRSTIISDSTFLFHY